MRQLLCGLVGGALLGMAVLIPVHADDVTPKVAINTPVSPPAWALLQRELLKANADACDEFFHRYFDERGFLLCVERWGGDDGPDDAIENCLHWPVLHAIGADDRVLTLYKKAWEGHLRQYTLAKTVEVPFARDGMYYKEFPVMFDWVHNGEGLNVFNNQGLSDPGDRLFGQRVRRYAGFYNNDDPHAKNYDPQNRLIRSMFNGSKGPLLRKATGLDWAGDPIQINGRFRPRHGENTYDQMVEHFKDYNDIVGDHPQNLLATTLALNAYMLTHEEKYKTWLLEYVDAWHDRFVENNGIIPTNIGLDGTIGGAADGKWYGGVYGWGFTVFDPGSQSMANRNTHQLGLAGFTNAYFLTGNDKYLDVWRKQADIINKQAKIVDGQKVYPRMYGDKGWYAYTPHPYSYGAREIWYLTMSERDRNRLGNDGWVAYLEGKNPTYPEQSLLAELESIRRKHHEMHLDPTTPDTRLADDPMIYNPASVRSLVQQMWGGYPPAHNGSTIYSRVRYFDPMKRRAGLPQNVSALVEKLTADETVLTLINSDQTTSKRVTIQAGGFGEHQFQTAKIGEETHNIDSSHLTVELAAGAGAQIRFATKRHANTPKLQFPWDQ